MAATPGMVRREPEESLALQVGGLQGVSDKANPRASSHTIMFINRGLHTNSNAYNVRVLQASTPDYTLKERLLINQKLQESPTILARIFFWADGGLERQEDQLSYRSAHDVQRAGVRFAYLEVQLEKMKNTPETL